MRNVFLALGYQVDDLMTTFIVCLSLGRRLQWLKSWTEYRNE